MAGRRFLEQAKLLGASESVGAIVDPQLAVDVQNMPLRRAVCDYQPLGDIAGHARAVAPAARAGPPAL